MLVLGDTLVFSKDTYSLKLPSGQEITLRTLNSFPKFWLINEWKRTKVKEKKEEEKKSEYNLVVITILKKQRI